MGKKWEIHITVELVDDSKMDAATSRKATYKKEAKNKRTKCHKQNDKHLDSCKRLGLPKTEVEDILTTTSYDAETGEITFLTDKAPSIYKENYIEFHYSDSFCFGHHVAWVHTYGKYPDKYIDHINGDKHDNRICNLREVNKRENALNKQVHRDGKLPGATKCMHGYTVTVQLYSGYKAYLGYYQDAKSASNAYFKYLLEHRLISWNFAEQIGVVREEIENTKLPIADIKFYQDSSRKPREYLGELSEEFLLEKARESA